MAIKIVVDTSVFISALISSKGSSRELIRRCLKGEYQPLMGNALLSEYESVIQRSEIIAKCPLTSEEISALLASLMSVSEWVYIYYLWQPNLKDEADNHLIELAVAGNAQIIATHNVKDFQNAELLFPNLRIFKSDTRSVKPPAYCLYEGMNIRGVTGLTRGDQHFWLWGRSMV